VPAPKALARFNRVVTNRVADVFAWSVPPFAVVLHRGRVSGRRYRTPVGAWPTEDGYVIALTYGAGCDWVRNVLAAGSCRLVRRGRSYRMTHPRVLGETEGMQLVPGWVREPLKLIRTHEFLRLTLDPSVSGATGSGRSP